MLVTTTETIPGKAFTILGLTRGSTVQCKNVGRDILSGLQNLVGGEMDSYTDLMNQSRTIATERMIQDATAMGADAIICMRYCTSSIAQGAAEVMAYGTAVKFV